MKIGNKISTELKWQIMLCLVTVMLLGAVEIVHPFYFLQDDSRVQFLPYYVHNLRSLLAGEFPQFNFHQHLGTPVSIQYAPFYPLYYLGALLSYQLRGDYFATMEIVATIHLLIAVSGFYAFMRNFRMHEISCCFGALAWTFCSFVMTVGNSWIHITGFAAYLPWILLYSCRQLRPFSSGNFVKLAFIRLLALALGNPQFFAYTVLFDLLTIGGIYLSGLRQRESGRVTDDSGNGYFPPFPRLAITWLSNYLFVVVLALPLLLSALHQVKVSFDRQQTFSWEAFTFSSYDLGQWLHGLLMPFSDLPEHLIGEQQFISHCGYLTLIFVLIALAGYARSRRNHLVGVFTLLAVFSLLWAGDILVTRVIYHLPVYNRFRWPFKLAFLTSFYIATVATCGFDQFYEGIAVCRRRGKAIAAAVAAALLLLHLFNFFAIYALIPQHKLSQHDDSVPFAEPLQKKLGDGRIVSVGLDVFKDGEKALWGHSAPSLGFNYATLWGLYHFGGYDGLLPERNFQATLGCNWRSDFNVAPGAALDVAAEVPLEHFRIWGVKWYVIDSRVPLVNADELKLQFADQYRNVYFDQAGRPFAYWQDRSSGSPAHKFGANAVEIVTEKAGEAKLVVNLLNNPYFMATVDGKQVSIEETEDGQVSLMVPGGRHLVVIRYTDRDLVRGVILSGVCLVSMMFWGGVRLYQRRKGPQA